MLRVPRPLIGVLATMAIGLVCAVSTNRAASREIPRKADGRPNLDGTWDYRMITPLERPQELGDKASFTEEEAVALSKSSEKKAERAVRAGDPGTYNQFWTDAGGLIAENRRTSLIVDPSDGRLPPLTAEAERRAAARTAALQLPPNGPEDRPTWERCLFGFNTGPPMFPSGYNNNIQIMQTRDVVAIFNEMVHDTRIVQMGARPATAVRRWLGVSSGRWNGDTLVVTTDRFTEHGTGTLSLRALMDENLQLVEQFSLAAPDVLRYKFTVSDPTVWTKPWTAVVLMARTTARIYEYACHEGNHAMESILRGARAQERRK